MEDKYNTTEGKKYSWKTSYVREWLNKTFIKEAFSDSERSSIQDTELTDAGVTDKVFLLSVDDVTNEEYGFQESSSDKADETRVAVCTNYSADPYTSDGSFTYYLRSPGVNDSSNTTTATVEEDGKIGSDQTTGFIKDPVGWGYGGGPEIHIRPAMWISESCYKELAAKGLEKAKPSTVSCFGKVDEDGLFSGKARVLKVSKNTVTISKSSVDKYKSSVFILWVLSTNGAKGTAKVVSCPASMKKYFSLSSYGETSFKINLNKGIKKGTYKIKAEFEKTEDSKAFSKTYTIKIK